MRIRTELLVCLFAASMSTGFYWVGKASADRWYAANRLYIVRDEGSGERALLTVKNAFTTKTKHEFLTITFTPKNPDAPITCAVWDEKPKDLTDR